MFHPGLPAAGAASGLLGWRLRRDPGIRCCSSCASSLAGRCDSCSQGGFSPSALLECEDWPVGSGEPSCQAGGPPWAAVLLAGASAGAFLGCTVWRLGLSGVPARFLGQGGPPPPPGPVEAVVGLFDRQLRGSVSLRAWECMCVHVLHRAANLRFGSGTCLPASLPSLAPLLWALAPSLHSCPAAPYSGFSYSSSAWLPAQARARAQAGRACCPSQARGPAVESRPWEGEFLLDSSSARGTEQGCPPSTGEDDRTVAICQGVCRQDSSVGWGLDRSSEVHSNFEILWL